jgi:DNA (cytosine-5)-methyltransferase 1
MRDLSYNEIMKLKHLDLFSGIGGFSLGLEATGGFETKAFCDIEEYPRQVLQKHWPHVKQYEDIKELNYERLKADGIDSIDIITGGYPCQPFSVAGRKKGEEDPRHLWPEYFRLVKELRPTWVIGENVSGHIKLGLDTVIEDLESEDYAVRPFSISASSIGANHQRERIWILANSRRSQWPRAELRGENENETRKENANQFERSSSTSSTDVANTNDERLQRQWQSRNQFTPRFNSSRESSEEGQGTVGQGWWESEPNMGRVAHGIPKRVDRLKSLGNSLVPQIPYYIGKTILEVMNGKTN